MQEVEQKIMGRVFSLGDRTVESIMTFRSELVWIDTAMTPEQIQEVQAAVKHMAQEVKVWAAGNEG